ncbi:MAG: hypothetical protein RL338_1217 [Chloroflexota bacterium]
MAATIWAIGEPAEGGLARVSEEVATAARTLAEASGGTAAGVVAGAGAALDGAAAGLARFLPAVAAVDVPAATSATWATAVGPALAALVAERRPDYLVIGGSPEGRDLAGVLSALLGWGVLTNAGGVRWADGGPLIEKTVFGGRLITTGAFTGGRGIVSLAPNSVDPVAAAGSGTVERVAGAAGGTRPLPPVRIVERIAEAGAAAPIEEAKVIVSGGRGVGGPDGFRVVEELAAALGGVVGASRAAVDSGWIPYARQVGQTGKIVKPALYVALGISGAIQHKVGMQSAGTIVAVNRDHEAPIADFADLLVVGDLFEVVPALVAQLRARGA